MQYVVQHIVRFHCTCRMFSPCLLLVNNFDRGLGGSLGFGLEVGCFGSPSARAEACGLGASAGLAAGLGGGGLSAGGSKRHVVKLLICYMWLE